MKKTTPREIKLNKETLRNLGTGALQGVVGGLTGTCITTCTFHTNFGSC
jgi:hypothetical protein